jgi:hypothetical protein
MPQDPVFSNGNAHTGNLPFTGHPTGRRGVAERYVSWDLAAGTAVTNTTTEGQTTKATLFANTIKAGTIVKFSGIVHVTAQNSTDTIVVRVRLGTAALPASNTALGATTAVDAEVDDQVFIDGWILFRDDPSATANAVWGLTMNNCDATGQATRSFFGGQCVTFDTTVDLNLQLSVTWSVADPGNSARSEALIVSHIERYALDPVE